MDEILGATSVGSRTHERALEKGAEGKVCENESPDVVWCASGGGVGGDQ